MPRSKDPRTYPAEMGTTLQRAYLEGTVSLECPTLRVAKSTMSQFYSFMQAVRKKREGMDSIWEAVFQVSMRIEGDFVPESPHTLHFYNKENSPIALLLRKGLNIPKLSEQADASAALLLDKLSGGKSEPAPPAPPLQPTLTLPVSYDLPQALPGKSAIESYLERKLRG